MKRRHIASEGDDEYEFKGTITKRIGRKTNGSRSHIYV